MFETSEESGRSRKAPSCPVPRLAEQQKLTLYAYDKPGATETKSNGVPIGLLVDSASGQTSSSVQGFPSFPTQHRGQKQALWILPSSCKEPHLHRDENSAGRGTILALPQYPIWLTMEHCLSLPASCVFCHVQELLPARLPLHMANKWSF